MAFLCPTVLESVGLVDELHASFLLRPAEVERARDSTIPWFRYPPRCRDVDMLIIFAAPAYTPFHDHFGMQEGSPSR